VAGPASWPDQSRRLRLLVHGISMRTKSNLSTQRRPPLAVFPQRSGRLYFTALSLICSTKHRSHRFGLKLSGSNGIPFGPCPPLISKQLSAEGAYENVVTSYNADPGVFLHSYNRTGVRAPPSSPRFLLAGLPAWWVTIAPCRSRIHFLLL